MSERFNPGSPRAAAEYGVRYPLSPCEGRELARLFVETLDEIDDREWDLEYALEDYVADAGVESERWASGPIDPECRRLGAVADVAQALIRAKLARPIEPFERCPWVDEHGKRCVLLPGNDVFPHATFRPGIGS